MYDVPRSRDCSTKQQMPSCLEESDGDCEGSGERTRRIEQACRPRRSVCRDDMASSLRVTPIKRRRAVLLRSGSGLTRSCGALPDARERQMPLRMDDQATASRISGVVPALLPCVFEGHRQTSQVIYWIPGDAVLATLLLPTLAPPRPRRQPVLRNSTSWIARTMWMSSGSFASSS